MYEEFDQIDFLKNPFLFRRKNVVSIQDSCTNIHNILSDDFLISRRPKISRRYKCIMPKNPKRF